MHPTLNIEPEPFSLLSLPSTLNPYRKNILIYLWTPLLSVSEYVDAVQQSILGILIFRFKVQIGDDSVDWPAVFTAAKAGGLKNYFIEQEQMGGWDAMVKGAAYLKTLTV